MKSIDAVKDKIVVKVIPKEEKSQGGIHIPEGAQTEPQGYGEVISVGEEVERVNRGDTLVFHVRAGQDMVFERENYKCLTYNEVYGILKDKKS